MGSKIMRFRLKLSDSDSEVIVKEFTRDSPPNHPTQSPVKIAKRSNIPIRIPSIETDLQALIKSVDDASKFNGTKSIGADKRIDTHATNGNNPLKMDSGDEKDVVIKLYDRSQSSSFDSAEAIRNVSSTAYSIHCNVLAFPRQKQFFISTETAP